MFVGLRVSGALARQLHATARDLAQADRALRIPALEDLHLTVQFLGPTPLDDVGPLTEALATVAAATPPLELAVQGLGAFPHARRPRVLWAGAASTPAYELLRLAEGVGRALGPLGYPPERRAFHPHVTLARVGGRPQRQTVAALADRAAEGFGWQRVSEVSLIVSRPGQGPYHYRNLTTIQLGRDAPESR